MFGLFQKKPTKVELSLFELPCHGFCAVAGESHYQEELRATKSVCSGSFEGRPIFTAALVPERDNEHDANAVAIHSPKGKLGYIPRETALAYRQLFTEITAHGYDGGACDALLTGGEPEKPSFGVVLRLADPNTCLAELRDGESVDG